MESNLWVVCRSAHLTTCFYWFNRAGKGRKASLAVPEPAAASVTTVEALVMRLLLMVVAPAMSLCMQFRLSTLFVNTI